MTSGTSTHSLLTKVKSQGVHRSKDLNGKCYAMMHLDREEANSQVNHTTITWKVVKELYINWSGRWLWLNNWTEKSEYIRPLRMLQPDYRTGENKKDIFWMPSAWTSLWEKWKTPYCDNVSKLWECNILIQGWAYLMFQHCSIWAVFIPDPAEEPARKT